MTKKCNHPRVGYDPSCPWCALETICTWASAPMWTLKSTKVSAYRQQAQVIYETASNVLNSEVEDDSA